MPRSCELAAAALLLASCGGGPEAPRCEPEVTWDGWAEGWFRTWCTSCHATTVTGADRYGAPPGVDFDVWAGVYAHRDRIAERSLGEQPTMPPVGAVPSAELEVLEQYLACGVEVAPAASPESCSDRPGIPGPVTITSAAEAADLCRQGVAIDGDLTVTGGEVDLGCLCRVEGDLVIEGAASVALGGLEWVTGALRIQGSPALTTVTAPKLAAVGGELTVDGASALTELSLPELDLVGGTLTVLGSATVAIHLPEVTSIGGPLLVEDAPALEELELFALERVDGELAVARAPRLERLDDVPSLVTVEGPMRLTGLEALMALDGFEALVEVDGPLTISSIGARRLTGLMSLVEVRGAFTLSDAPHLEGIEGLDELSIVEGDLRLADLPALASPPTLAALERVDGTLELSRTGAVMLAAGPRLLGARRLLVSDNPQLTAIDGFGSLQGLGELALSGNPALEVVTAFDALDVIDGDVLVSGVGADLALTGLGGLQGVGGSLSIVDNPGLTRLDDLGQLDQVGEDLTITGNPLLPHAAAEAFGAQVQSNGVETISGNGP